MKLTKDFEPIYASLCSIEGFGAAIVAAGALAAGGAVAAGSIQASGQKQAAQTQAQVENNLMAQEQPFIQGGYSAETALNDLLGLSGTDASGKATTPTSFGGLPAGYLTQTFQPTQQQLEAYPGYQFQKQQGQLATESGSTPGVGALSGASLKALTQFNQGLAASNYNNYFNQFQTQQNNIFSRLNSQATLGQNAAGNLGSQESTLGTGVAQAQAAAAGSTAASIGGATTAAGNAASQYGIYQSLFGNNQGSYAGLGSQTELDETYSPEEFLAAGAA